MKSDARQKIITIFLLILMPIAGSYGENNSKPDNNLNSNPHNNSQPSSQQNDTGTTIEIPGMDNTSLDIIIHKLDPDAQGRLGYWQLQNKGIMAQIITDERADRMRIIVQVAAVEGLDEDLLFRLLQANFDTALDARYAIAQDILWSTFIHPLSSLDEREFVSGFAQTVTLAETFGETYSSGALRFGGGDAEAAEQELYRNIIEQFEKSGQSI